MAVELNWIAILLATIACFGVGALWYGFLFNEQWVKYAKINRDKAENTPYGIFLVPPLTTFISTLVIAHAGYITYMFFDVSFAAATLATAVVLWLGFSFTTTAVNNVFEGRPWQLSAIDTGYSLAIALTAALIISLFGV